MYKEFLNKYLKIFVSSIIYLEKKQIFFIYLFTFLIFTAILFNYSVFPSVMKISDHKKMNGDLTESIVAAKGKIRELKIYKEKMEEIDILHRKIKRILIENGEVQNLVTVIAEYGDKAGVDFIEFNPMPRRKLKYFNEVPLSVTIKGGFLEIFEFIGNVSGGIFLITFENIKISTGDSSNRLSVQCVVKGYSIDET